jgi:hypothetical protein
MDVMTADNGSHIATTSWMSAEYSDIDSSSVSTIEVLENNGSIFILNGSDLTSRGGGVDLDATSNGTEDGSSLSDDEATIELITMIGTAFILGLVILATVIGKFNKIIETCFSSMCSPDAWKFYVNSAHIDDIFTFIEVSEYSKCQMQNKILYYILGKNSTYVQYVNPYPPNTL